MSEAPWNEGDQIMKRFGAMIGSVLLMAVAACCVFGFLATFEPTDNSAQFMAFRIGYAAVGVGCTLGMGFLIANAVRK